MWRCPAEGNFSQVDDCGDSEIVSGAQRAEDHERDLVAGAKAIVHEKVIVGGGPRDVDIHNFSEVVWKTLCALDRERDVQVCVWSDPDTLGPCGAGCRDYGVENGRLMRRAQMGASRGIYARPWPDEILMDSLTKAKIDANLEVVGIIMNGGGGPDKATCWIQTITVPYGQGSQMAKNTTNSGFLRRGYSSTVITTPEYPLIA